MGTLVDPRSRAAEFCRVALEEGAQLAGVADGRRPVSHAGALEDWLARGYNGPLEWMERNTELRARPAGLLPGLSGILVVAISSHHPCMDPCDKPRISRHARGRDYHKVLRGILVRTARRMERDHGPFGWRACVDTVPLLERYWGWQAGLGWIGKNCLLINERFGSWLLLGELLTDLDLHPATPAPDRCGRCTRCLSACPTRALVSPGVLDANLCLSAQTIENRAERLPSGLDPLPGRWAYGCDDCQLCCPWNRPGRGADGLPPGHPELAPDPELEARIATGDWTPPPGEPWSTFWDRLTRGKSLRRATAAMWQRNLAASAGDPPAGPGDPAKGGSGQ